MNVKLVVDANILFAALIRNSITRRLLLFLDNELYAPEYLVDEICEHIDEVEQKTGFSKREIKNILDTLIVEAKITLFPASQFNAKLSEAENILSDSDDAPYLALALHLSCPVWSNDKKLKGQKKVRIITTEELSRKI